MTNHRIQLMLLMAGTLVTLGATQAQGAPASAPPPGAGPPRAVAASASTTAVADPPGGADAGPWAAGAGAGGGGGAAQSRVRACAGPRADDCHRRPAWLPRTGGHRQARGKAR
jgi:hypothetical protein